MVTNEQWLAIQRPTRSGSDVGGTSASGTRSGTNYTMPMSSGQTVSINGGPPSRAWPSPRCRSLIEFSDF